MYKRQAEDAAGLRPLIALWKQHRARLHGGTIHPVGQCPSGAAGSGFCSLDADGQGGYLIALREPCAPETATWALPLTGAWTTEVLAGAGSVAVDSRQCAAISWDAAPGYLFARLCRTD